MMRTEHIGDFLGHLRRAPSWHIGLSATDCIYLFNLISLASRSSNYKNNFLILLNEEYKFRHGISTNK